MPTFNLSIDGKTYHVDIPNPGANPLQVVVDGQAFDVDIAGVMPGQPVPPPVVRPVPKAASASAPAPAVAPVAVKTRGTDNSTRDFLTAPMPGTILSVEVCVGQPVEECQVVCVLEAMKMKNPVRTSRAGTVAEIAVNAGQTVCYGDPLVRIA